jgi:hypothetical protein
VAVNRPEFLEWVAKTYPAPPVHIIAALSTENIAALSIEPPGVDDLNAPHPAKVGGKVAAAARAIDGEWPAGIPEGLSKKTRNKKINDRLQAEGLDPVSDSVIDRAIRSLRNSTRIARPSD